MYWGKHLEAGGVVDHLSLIDHSLDVAAAFVALCRFGQASWHFPYSDTSDIALCRLAVIVFLHDIGKGNAGFQNKITNKKQFILRGHLREATWLVTEETGKKLLFDEIDISKMRTWFTEPRFLPAMLMASWSHHGLPIDFNGRTCVSLDNNRDSHALNAIWRPTDDLSPKRLLKEFGDAIRAHFGKAFEAGTEVDRIPATPDFQARFVGLLTLADWIASNVEWFDFHGHERAGQSRYEWALRRADAVLDLMRIAADHGTVLRARQPDFADVFPGKAPNVLQASMETMAVPCLGSITIVESDTGSGKTEAALIRALTLYKTGCISGIVFALPTRTSAVQIHERVAAAIAAAFGDDPPPVTMAVPGYIEPDANAPLCDPSYLHDESPQNATGWFVENPKRYLVSPIVVGTIDQLLFSVIKVRHAHMRAAAIAGKLLIIDEVHASDAYMTHLTKSLVDRHVAAGGHVILMSATLADKAAAAYLNRPAACLKTAAAAPYPLITARETGQSPSLIHVDAGPERHRKIWIDMVQDIDDPHAIAARAADAARAGAKVLVIRNTVGGCIETNEALTGMVPDDFLFRVGPASAHVAHHGRYAPRDRRLLDIRVQKRFGKQRDPGPAILVATQTVEQSLDIDADLLITDIAPADVLLQRLGRLHRHRRDDRPAGFDAPRCIVLTPDDLTSLARRPRYGIGRDRAYPDVRIVEMTKRLLGARKEIVLPDECRSLVEGSCHGDVLAALEAEDPLWIDCRNAVWGDELAARATARSVLIDFTAQFGTPESYEGWGTKAEKSATSRLGASPLAVVFQSEDAPRSPISGDRITRLSLPLWMTTGEIDPQEAPIVRSADRSGFSFDFAGGRYRYDRHGLQKDR